MKSEKLPIIDVDGSYVYRKQQSDSGSRRIPTNSLPAPPLSGWENVSKENLKVQAPKIPTVTSGLLKLSYLSVSNYYCDHSFLYV